MKRIQENQTALIDYVFENRNKDYGAYALRLEQNKYSKKAFIGGITIVFITLFSSFIAYKIKPAKPKVSGILTHINENNIPIEFLKEKAKLPKQVAKTKTKIEKSYIIVPNVPIEKPMKPVKIDINETPLVEGPTDGPIDGLIVDYGEDDGTKGTISLPLLENKPIEKPQEESILDFTEKMPEFPGGYKALAKFLQQNLMYPNPAINAGIQGKVFLSFIVTKNGQVTAIKVEKGIGFNCDEEAIRVVSLMPNWLPAENNKQKVSFRYRLPIVFALEQ